VKPPRSFGIRPGDQVLDVGCGADPFPLATHLADRSFTDHSERFDLPIPTKGRPFIECSVESMPFADKAFDFVYCSQVLEHVADPAAACRELVRVGRRGYIECPRSWLEFVLGSGEHRWLVDHECDTLIFREKLPEEYQDILGMRLKILGWFRNPNFARYFSSPDVWSVANVEFYWEGSFSPRVLTRADRSRSIGLAQHPPTLVRPRRSADDASLRRELHEQIRRRLM
jgi:SAM-dependent methyltransferase